MCFLKLIGNLFVSCQLLTLLNSLFMRVSRSFKILEEANTFVSSANNLNDNFSEEFTISFM